MKIDFRIDWGYQYLYSRRHYHPFYHWDGHLECSDGVIEKVFRLDYPVLWFGPGHCAKETPLDSPCWECTTHRRLAGIRVVADVAADAAFRLVTRFRKGRGIVYTVAAYAYPGHEALREVMAALIARLASQNLPQTRVADTSREVFWNEWVEDGGVRRLMLLNTDWTVAGNRKAVRIEAGDVQFQTEVVEREAKILTVLPGVVLEPDSCELHLEVIANGEVRCHGTGRHQITVHRANGVSEMVPVDLTRSTVALTCPG